MLITIEKLQFSVRKVKALQIQSGSCNVVLTLALNWPSAVDGSVIQIPVLKYHLPFLLIGLFFSLLTLITQSRCNI